MENKITPFKAKAEGVLIEVPEDAMYPIIDDAKFLVYAQGDYTAVQKLPPGDWQLAGTSDTMSEDDWKGIVEQTHDNVRIDWDALEGYVYGNVYKNYRDDEVLYTTTESGHSLLPDPTKRYAVILKKNK